MSNRIHVTGASGSGVTTLGRALADIYGVPHHDTDDYYWLPTDPPYRTKRDVSDRLRLMHELFVPRSGWVLSGSLMNWAQEIEPCFDAVIFVATPTDIRLARIRRREVRRYGADALSVGHENHDASEAFLEWAARYDDPEFEGRSRARHEAWMATLACPVIRVSGDQPTNQMVDRIVGHWRRPVAPAST